MGNPKEIFIQIRNLIILIILFIIAVFLCGITLFAAMAAVMWITYNYGETQAAVSVLIMAIMVVGIAIIVLHRMSQ